MANPIKINELAALLKTRRGKQGLRDLATEIDVSASTLSRVEQGKIPDLETYVKICRWLEVPTEKFLDSENQATSVESPVSESEAIMAHLRAGKVLDPDTKNALEHLIRMAYHKAIDLSKKPNRKA